VRDIARLVGLLGVLLACGGSAATREFRLADVEEDEAAIAGRVHVRYNGKMSPAECSLCFNGDDCVEANRQGFVFHHVPRGRNAFSQIRCMRDASPYHHSFNGQGFSARGKGTVTYFGDLYIDWKTDGGYKTSQLYGLAGVLADEASDDGQATLAIVNRPEATLFAFTRHVRQELPPSVSLVGSVRIASE
jgi:hypothetical protein